MDIFEIHDHHLSSDRLKYDFLKLARGKNIIDEESFNTILRERNLLKYSEQIKQINFNMYYSEDRLLDVDTEIFSDDE